MNRLMTDVDNLIRKDGPFSPFWGWHDDHRAADGTPEYRPALQQVRSEFEALATVLADRLDLNTASALQLGSGMCDASHHVWRILFAEVITIDWRNCLRSWSGHSSNLNKDVNATEVHPGADTHSKLARALAAARGPYDFLFIDAGHKVVDVFADHQDYGALVRPGGIIAFHDACERPGHAVEVHDYLDAISRRGIDVNLIQGEVGVAWIVK